jgi:metal-responsive CopG/Arc/MetJ family transcriptional regulator
MKRTLVSLPDELFDIMRTKLKGKFGESDSEIIRGVVIAYLSEKGYLKEVKNRVDEQIADMQEDMINALVEILEKKGVVSGNDIDNSVRKRLKSKQGLTKFEDLK